MTLPHFADSRRMRSANASGELTIEKMKLGARNFSRKPGSPKMRCVCALSLITMSCGVPLGAANPDHAPASEAGSPLSAGGGPSGRGDLGSVLRIARHLRGHG